MWPRHSIIIVCSRVSGSCVTRPLFEYQHNLAPSLEQFTQPEPRSSHCWHHCMPLCATGIGGRWCWCWWRFEPTSRSSISVNVLCVALFLAHWTVEALQARKKSNGVRAVGRDILSVRWTRCRVVRLPRTRASSCHDSYRTRHSCQLTRYFSTATTTRADIRARSSPDNHFTPAVVAQVTDVIYTRLARPWSCLLVLSVF